MYLNLDEISRIQLDHTSRCNCTCPQCGRTGKNSNINPKLPITDLTLDDYKKILEPFHGRKYDIMHCGNFGDAFVSPTFDETFDYCLSSTVRRIKIMTNGSMRTPGWWADLAKKSLGRLIVVFAIDGLEDTNHIYRIGSNFNRIIENAKAFIDAGGHAEWVFIQFNHNKHQVQEAMNIAGDLGFRKFIVKTSARFAEQGLSQLINKNDSLIVDLPNNHHKTDMQKISDEYGSFGEYIKQTPISCRFKEEKIIFIDMCMNVWPCCWMGGPPYFEEFTDQDDSFNHALSLYEPEFNNLRIHGWDILKHDFFKNYLEQSWNSPDDHYKRLYICGRTCGDTFKFSGGDKKNLKETKLRGKNE